MLQGGSGLEVVHPVRQGAELLIRGSDEAVGIAPGALAAGVDLLFGKQAGSVVVQVGREYPEEEVIDRPCEALGDVRISQLLADNGAVLALHQGIVIAFPGATSGLFDAQLLEQPCDPPVDVLRTIVGMAAEDHEGEGLQQLLQGGQQVVLGDLLHADGHLPLGDLIDCIDVIDPLDTVQVALVHGIDAQEAGTATGPGLAPLADPHPGPPGLLETSSPVPVVAGLAQGIQVPVGDRGQALVADIPVQFPGPLAQLAGGGPAEVPVQGIQGGQGRHIRLGIASAKGIRRSPATVADAPGIPVLADQPGDLGPGPARDLLQVGPHHAPLGLAERGIAQLAQAVPHPHVGFLAGLRFKIKAGCAAQKCTDLLHRLESLVV